MIDDLKTGMSAASDSPPKAGEIQEWHAANPHVYRQFKRNAYRIKATGRKHYSAYPIFYHMRDLAVRSTGRHGDVFRRSTYDYFVYRVLFAC